MKKRILIIISISIFLLALTYHSFEIFPEKIEEKTKQDTSNSILVTPQMKADGTAHKLHWEEALQDLEETFDLSEEEVTDLQSLIF